jgi:hypothetical protein
MAEKKKQPVVKGTEVTVTVNSKTGKAGVLSPTAKARKERIKTAFGDGFLKDATKLYGSLVNLYKDIPELRKIMQDSFVNEDTPETFLTKVGSSKWAESRSKQQETDTAQKAADPVQYERDMQDWIAQTQAAVGKTGVTISQDQIKEIAMKAKQNGWSGNLFQNYVGAEVIKYNNAAPAAEGVTQKLPSADSLRKISRDYGIDPLAADVSTWAEGIVSGTKTEEQWTNIQKNAAKTLHPSIANRLDGETFTDIMSPYASLAAKVLDLNAADINMADPKWASVFINDPVDATKSRLATSGEWQATLRKRPEWQETTGAYTEYADAAKQLTALFRGNR